MQQAHDAAPVRVQEVYLALLANARRDESRPSPGKVTRTMRLQAHQAGKRRRPSISRLTGQPIAPGKLNLTSYLEPAVYHQQAEEKERNPLDIDAVAVTTAILGGQKRALARTRALNAQEQSGKAHVTGATPPSMQDIMVPGTVAHRQFEANLAAAFGHFEELDALEEESINAEVAIAVEASQPRELDGDFSNSEIHEYSLPPKLQLPFARQARGSRNNRWQAPMDIRPKTSADHSQSWRPTGAVPFQAQVDGEEKYFRPPTAIPGQQVEAMGMARPIQAAGLQEEFLDVPMRLPGHGGGAVWGQPSIHWL